MLAADSPNWCARREKEHFHKEAQRHRESEEQLLGVYMSLCVYRCSLLQSLFQLRRPRRHATAHGLACAAAIKHGQRLLHLRDESRDAAQIVAEHFAYAQHVAHQAANVVAGSLRDGAQFFRQWIVDDYAA